MSLSTTSLYYPFIKIPESTLVHSLLFKDRIKRIIPPSSDMDDYQRGQAQSPNDICRQYLGYEFIEDADYRIAKELIVDSFCAFLDEANKTKHPDHFVPLLGNDYRKRLAFEDDSLAFGTQHFIFAHKFAPQVFEKLESLQWMRNHKDMPAYELSNELCNVYMSLLAACISEQTKEPITTGLIEADEIIRTPLFSQFFGGVIPSDIQSDNNRELCVNLLLGSSATSAETGAKPLHDILTFPEAVRIRCGLEDKRREFCATVDKIINKAKAVDPKDPEAFISLEVDDVIENATEYLNSIKEEAAKNVSDERKDLVTNIKTGVSLLLPPIGTAADVIFKDAPMPGSWSSAGVIFSLGIFFIPKVFKTGEQQNFQKMLTTRQKAYLFMNQLWDIRDMKSESV